MQLFFWDLLHLAWGWCRWEKKMSQHSIFLVILSLKRSFSINFQLLYRLLMVTKFGSLWKSLTSIYPAPHFKMWHVYCIIFSFKILAETRRRKEKFNSTFCPLVFKTLNNLISTLFPHHISEHSSSPSLHIPLWNDLAITSLPSFLLSFQMQMFYFFFFCLSFLALSFLVEALLIHEGLAHLSPPWNLCRSD